MASSTKFSVDYAKRVANCKKCRQQLPKGELRMARMVPNPFTTDSNNPSEMKQYFHAECLFETLTRCRATTKVIESPADIEGWSNVQEEDRSKILDLISNLEKVRAGKGNGTKTPSRPSKKQVESDTYERESSKKKKEDSSKKHLSGGNSEHKEKRKAESTEKKSSKKEGTTTTKEGEESGGNEESAGTSGSSDKAQNKRGEKRKLEVGESCEREKEGKKRKVHVQEEDIKKERRYSKFDSFKLFCKLCEVLASVSKYTDKSTAVNMFVNKDGYDGDMLLLVRMLLPSTDQRVFNLKEKQLIKLFSNIFGWSPEELTDSFNQTGDVSITIRQYFEKSIEDGRKSHLSLQDVDSWLNRLTEYTKEDDQQRHLNYIAKRATPLELQFILRLIKKDLRINAGAKHILDGIKKGAYEAFQNSRDLKSVLEKCRTLGSDTSFLIDSGIALGTPVKPMLAEPCRSVEQAMKTCVNGMFSEIKYDGERLQLHKSGDTFTFFSRSLRPVQEHKVSHLSDVIPQAFPKGGDMILDAEVLLVDTATGKPLPFGTLGVHKKEQFANALVCLFVFDCLLFDGKCLVDRPLKERKKILEENINEVPNRVLLSNYQLIRKNEHDKLKTMIWKAIDEGLEGLVLKDLESVYEPGKRHWLKVKKDYLEEGKMADTADLIVLGAYYGTGCKGGMMSVFLMGVYDETSNVFLTVTKCGNGHDDATLDRINKELQPMMRKIGRDYESVPCWLKCSRSLVPDFVVDDPKKAPVWEITGAEFSRSDNHSARGISIRFPRVTKIRDDKSWSSATNMDELQKMFEVSKQKTDFDRSVEDEIPLFAKNNVNNPFGDSAALDGDIGKLEANKMETTEDNTNHQDDDEKPCLEGGSPKKEETAPKQKEATSGDASEKVTCKYGSKCYRKNPEHLRKYHHSP
uniref:DNA ligase 3 n=1 Tax=Parascaris univalens TaxID=6257 RepID=A0A915B2S5_PARUN